MVEFSCQKCKTKFESLLSPREPKSAECPKCGTISDKALVSVFAVAGRGDLRESTMHGCHDHDLCGSPHEEKNQPEE